MSIQKPKELLNPEEDGLLPLTYDSDAEDSLPLDSEDMRLARRLSFSASPINPCLSSTSEESGSEPGHLDSSTDSAVGELAVEISKPKSYELDSYDRSRKDFYKNLKENVSTTPPYKGVRALRLFCSPQSPQSLLDQARLSTVEVRKKVRSRLLYKDKQDVFKDQSNSILKTRRIRPLATPKRTANVNPFTKASLWMSTKSKRGRDSLGESINDSAIGNCLDDYIDDVEETLEDEMPPLKRMHLRDASVSRYETEFLELSQVGSGEFGSVYRCINRLDGCDYALKKSRKPLKGTADERRALNEVYAHAVLGRHTHVVRYYSAWAENDHMLIQNEFCNGGSLADVIEQNKKLGATFSEPEIKQILLHIAQGLKYIHSVGLAHMDIKPGNIFIVRNTFPSDSPRTSDLADDGFEEDDSSDEEVIYKIGDLGHVTPINSPEVEEGDCRYLPTEILQDNYKHLPKADVFALGLTMYEVASNTPLPKNGPEWHRIREGNLPYLTKYSLDFNRLLKQMIHPDPEKRPSSAALVHHRTLVPYCNKTKAQLNKELQFEKMKNEVLSEQLQRASLQMKAQPLKGSSSDSRLNKFPSSKFYRSNSVTLF